MDDFSQRLLDTYRIEAAEHVALLSSGLLELENATSEADRQRLVESMFREAHSLKGASQAVHAPNIERICQALESAFAQLMRERRALSSSMLNNFLGAVDGLSRLLEGVGENEPASVPVATSIVEMLGCLTASGDSADSIPSSKTQYAGEKAASSSHARFPAESPAPIMPGASETVRVVTGKLDALLREVEDIVSISLANYEQAREFRSLERELANSNGELSRSLHSLRLIEKNLSTRNGDRATSKERAPLAHLTRLLEHNHQIVSRVFDQMREGRKRAELNARSLHGLAAHVLNDAKALLMLPAASLLEALPRVVRDFAIAEGKEIGLELTGKEVQVDKRILDGMRDPVIHLVRNCIAHGIELPAVRKQKGKAARGEINVDVSFEDGGFVKIVVADDGAGIDIQRVKQRAAAFGRTIRETEEDALGLIFESGVSTSSTVSELSGRGLGLAIVREKVDLLCGTIECETRPDEGAMFTIRLPVTMSTFRGVLVSIEGHLYAAPTSQVARADRIRRDAIQSSLNAPVYTYGDRKLDLVRLADALSIPRQPRAESERVHDAVMVLSVGGRAAAFVVDEIVGEQEILLKDLGSGLSRIRFTLGAAVLGTGAVVPVLNGAELVRSIEGGAYAKSEIEPAAPRDAQRARRVLVVEDSITSRMLLKNILQSFGYEVDVAVDGMDAFTKLRQSPSDIVVSDVDMPRMNGFDLTSRIRSHETLKHTPVVLVTSLESREDRERGMDVGANAYIVKSSFDQGNLLEILQMLA